MTLAASGQLSINDIAVELSISNSWLNLNDSRVRTLGGFGASGQIDINSFHGKSDVFNFNMVAASNVDFRAAAITAGWNQSSRLVATIPGGTVIQATWYGVYAMMVQGSYPKGVSLINNGYIIGGGGYGGTGGLNGAAGQYGGAGGASLYCGAAISIWNYGYISGGGGGGGGGGSGIWATTKSGTYYYGGGGGGGGATNYVAPASGGGGSASTGGQTNGSNGGNGGWAGAGGGGASYANLGNGGSGGWWGANGSAGGGTGGAAGGGGYSVVGSGNVSWGAWGNVNGALN